MQQYHSISKLAFLLAILPEGFMDFKDEMVGRGKIYGTYKTISNIHYIWAGTRSNTPFQFFDNVNDGQGDLVICSV